MQDPNCERVLLHPQKRQTSILAARPFYLRSLAVASGLFLLIGLLISSAHAEVANVTSSKPHLPSSWTNISLAAISGTYQPLHGLDATPLIGYVMWGNYPTAYLPTVADHARYCKFGQNNDSSQQGIAWVEQNHPDWISYRNDKVTPAYYTVGSVVDKTHLPLDMANPAVQDFVAQQCAQPAISQGFDAVGFDHATTRNVFAVAGHFDTNHQWVQQYSGAQDDPIYRSSIKIAFAQLMAKVRAIGTAQSHPLFIAANDYPDLNRNAYWFDLLPYIDVIFDEAGFTKLGNAGSPYLTSTGWYTKVQDLQDLQTMPGKAVIINGLEPYQINADHLPRQQDIQWVLANYLMVKSQYTYQAFMGSTAPDYHRLNVTVPEYFAQVGTPLGVLYPSQGVYMREYSNGLTIVNPSPSAAYTVTLPAGVYKDLYGNPVTTVTMKAHSGLVLVKI